MGTDYSIQLADRTFPSWWKVLLDNADVIHRDSYKASSSTLYYRQLVTLC